MPQQGGKYYSIYADDRDERIAELEDEVERLRTAASTAGVQIDAGSTASIATVSQMQKEIDFLESALRNQRSKYTLLEDEIDCIKEKNEQLVEALESSGMARRDEAIVECLQKQMEIKDSELKASRALILEMQKIGWANLPEKVVEESKKSAQRVEEAKKQRDDAAKKEMEAKGKLGALEGKLQATSKALEGDKKIIKDLQDKLKSLTNDKNDALKQLNEQWEQKEARRVASEKRMVEFLEYQIAQLKVQASAGGVGPSPLPSPGGRHSIVAGQAKPGAPGAPGAKPAAPAAGGAVDAQVSTLKQQNAELMEKLKLAVEEGKKGGGSSQEMQNQAQFYKKKLEEKDAEIDKLQKALKQEKSAAQSAAANVGKVKELEERVKKLEAEKKAIADNYQTEMLLRKKYFNMVEDMKGKIRVYCRVRPIIKQEQDKGHKMSVNVPDEYTIVVQHQRGPKEFQFDRIFTPTNTQEDVFEDTNHLIQSAVDGYNVCIFAYGQTGSGKTFTLIGDIKGGKPGVAPKAFSRIFDVLNEPNNQKKYNFVVTAYMLELYNDKLLDLLKKNAEYSEKMEIKKDEKGMVYIPSASLRTAKTPKDLLDIFDEGIQSRHVASTKMNSESSRSHLIISIIIESTNKTSKQLVRGKLSIIDLAGSERLSKSGATGENMKEANSINMSLSALGDVIAALTSEQAFIPYRNNKLTMLMQDSLGGNAKTLMFVNASPVDFNTAETLNSLSYASRVKLIKNDASKNTESEEVARLKKMIAQLQGKG